MKMNEVHILKYDSQDSKEIIVYEFDKDRQKHRFAVVPVTETFAKISGFTPEGEQTSLEAGYSLRSDQGGKARRTMKGKFAVTWFDNYTLSYKGTDVLQLKCQRQQQTFCESGTKVVKRVLIGDASSSKKGKVV